MCWLVLVSLTPFLAGGAHFKREAKVFCPAVSCFGPAPHTPLSASPYQVSQVFAAFANRLIDLLFCLCLAGVCMLANLAFEGHVLAFVGC